MEPMMMDHLGIAKIVILNVLSAIKEQITVLNVMKIELIPLHVIVLKAFIVVITELVVYATTIA
jgi:hypothetical protein